MNRRLFLGVMGLALVFIMGISTSAGMVLAQDEASFPLAEPGSYAVGWKAVNYVDEARDNRRVNIKLFYPAVRPEDSGATWNNLNAEPDRSGAPYPLILTGINDTTLIDWQLSTHGFVVAVVTDSSPVSHYNNYVVDFPRDIIFALDQVASDPPELLEDIIDADHTGVMGYSWDGYGALAVSGARFDPEHYLAVCAGSLEDSGYPGWWEEYACTLAVNWDTFTADLDAMLKTSDDGLWQPITDERIQAVAPMGPEGALLFGPRGLAAVDRPVLIISGTRDTINPYRSEAVYIYEHLGTSDRTLISFVGEGHMMPLSAERFKKMSHFVTAFFGYHLQGNQEYAALFDQAYVGQFEELAWGIYTGD